MIYSGPSNEYFEIEDLESACKKQLNAPVDRPVEDSCKEIIWFLGDKCKLIIDSVPYTFQMNDVIFLTQFHMVEVESMCRLKLLRFNRPFYCISEFDGEVGCRGILFFGASDVPVIRLNEGERQHFENIWTLLEKEICTGDSLQLDMLQSLIKTILIVSTRIYKMQTNFKEFDTVTTEVIRSFNYLVELHFREKHTVAEYASLLFKSPKTLSNIFGKMGKKTPSQYIYDRIMTEARRLLRYTEKPVAEIGHQLGFADVQSFSRFFSKNEGNSPIQFRENVHSGNIANS